MTVSADTFKALGDPTRLALFTLLLERPHHVGELVERLDAAQSRVSRHLRVLKEAGLVEDHRQGRWVEYRVAPGDGSIPRLLSAWSAAVAPRSAPPRPGGAKRRGESRRADSTPPAVEPEADNVRGRATEPSESSDDVDESSFVVNKVEEPFDSYLL